MDQLVSWKDKENRKPLTLFGVRQSGKTWLMKEFGKTQFAKTAYISFYRNNTARDIFEHNIAIVVYKAYYGVYVEFKVYLRATDIKPCINLYQIASLRNADLWRVKIQQYNTGTSSTESGSVLSDLHCYNGAK